MESQCTSCDAGFYCGEANLTAATGPCSAGYYCVEGVDTPPPDTGFTGTGGPCPEGHFCEVQTSVPEECPAGTFNNITHLEASSECTLCSYGHYCAVGGLTEPTGECAAGFYCLRGASSPNNPTLDSSGGPCPEGHFCPNGTSYPLPCPCGSYNPTTGQSECAECPVGFYCPENSTDYSTTDCLAGHYCPAGTCHGTDFPCPRGYYNPNLGANTIDECLPCEPGSYCETVGLDAPTGLCDAGWFCSRGAFDARPHEYGSQPNATSDELCFCDTNFTPGGQCQPGEVCPQGSEEPLPCTGGMIPLPRKSNLFFFKYITTS